MAGKDVAPSFLRLHPTHTIDCSSVVPAPSSSLLRSLHPKCVCFHPTKPLLALGVSGHLAVYDLQTNTRIGRVDFSSLPVDMAFAPDGTVLIVATQDWVVWSISTVSWKSRQIVPRRAKMDKPLTSCLLAVAPGHNPHVYFCRYAKDTVRLASLQGPRQPINKKGEPTGPAPGWGSKVKLDVQKAVLGLACHHVDQQVLVLTADGTLRGYAVAGGNGDQLTPLYAVPIQEPAEKSVPAAGVLTVVPHPAVAGGAIILQASRVGTASVLEAPGRSAPTVLAKGKVPGWMTTLGMGLCKSTGMLVAFGLSESGRLRCSAWRMAWRAGSPGLALQQTRIEPQEITPLLDAMRRAKVTAAGVNGLSTAALLATTQPVRTSANNGLASFSQQPAQQQQQGASSAPWQSLWSVAPSWSHDVSSSCLLDAQLAPLVMRVVVHPLLDCIACQLEPSFAVQGNQALMLQGVSQLSAEELMLARRTCSVPLLSLVDHELHHQGWRGALVSPQSTGLHAWQPQIEAELKPTASVSSSVGGAAAAAAVPAAAAALELPPHVYYLAGCKLMKYSLITRAAVVLAELPAETASGAQRVGRQLLHSPKQGAWLALLEAAQPPGAAPAASAEQAGRERWGWALVNEAVLAEASSPKGSPPVVLSGKYAAFIGPEDEHVVVMGASGRTLAVFGSQASLRSSPSPLFTLNLEATVLGPGLPAPLFPGPPMTNAPVPDPKPTIADSVASARKYKGSGIVLWQAADHCLSMATLPAASRVPLDDDNGKANASEDGDSEAPGAGAVPVGHHFGPQQRQATLPLLPGEAVLLVSWQTLSSVAPKAPCDAIGAVLTTQRMLLISSALRVLASASVSGPSGLGSSLLPEPVTGMVWAGPMLLLSTVSGHVLQMSWTGTLHPVCVASPLGYMSVVGVTSDSLLLLRSPLGSSGGSAGAGVLMEVVPRPASLLQPLTLGWASLAASGLLPGMAATARPALKLALESFDPAGMTPRGLWALISAGAWDVAAAIASAGDSHLPQLDPSVKLAANASAGRWASVQATLQLEAARALHAPSPPPRGSSLHAKLVAAGAGALFHGQLSIAMELLQAAGEWAAAMILSVCQGSVQGVYTISQKVATAANGAATSEVASAAQLASALRSLYGGAGTQVGDLQLQLMGAAPGEQLESAEGWTLASSSAVPAAVAVAGKLPSVACPDSEVGPIPPCDRASALAYYGLTSAAAASVAAAAGAPAAGASGHAARLGGTSASGTELAGRAGASAGDLLDAASVASSNDAQAAARAEFMANYAGTGALDFSSDDSDSEATGSAAGTASAGGPARRQIKIQIRNREAGVGAQQAPTVDLREAAKALKLNPPGAMTRFAPPPGLPLPDLTSAPSAASVASSAALPQFAPGVSSVDLYQQAVAFMEQADWRNAAAHFSRAMAVLSREEAGHPTAAQRLAFCAQYYAAVRLLEAATAGAGAREARLYRYVASLKLDDRHAAALLREAINRNKAVRNFRYAADQLTTLIGQVADSAPAEYLAQLQGDIEECDRHGGGNRDIKADENTGDWVACVVAASSKDDVDLLVVPLLAQA